MAMNFHRKLPIPQEVKKEFHLTSRMEQIKAERDASIKAVFDGSSDKFILIIGPCSADHSEPVLEYISRLRMIQEQVADKIIIIPRIYTNKPRTTGQGYKGMLHQPDPEAKPDMYKGLVAIRELHLAALRDYDFTYAELPLSVRPSVLRCRRRALGGEPTAPFDSQRYRGARGHEEPHRR